MCLATKKKSMGEGGGSVGIKKVRTHSFGEIPCSVAVMFAPAWVRVFAISSAADLMEPLRKV